MGSLLVKRFIDLVQFDREINEKEKQLTSVQNQVNALEQKIELYKNDVKKEYEALYEFRKIVDAKELEMKVLDQQEKKIKHHLDVIVDSRSYSSLQRELQNIKKQQHELEEGLLRAWNELENAEKKYKSKKGEEEKNIEALEQDVQKSVLEKRQLQEEIKRLLINRPEKQQNIDDELLAQYEAMQKRVSNPVVPLESGSCSACFYSIPQQDIINLQKGNLLQCKDCFRFLYATID